MHADHAAFLGMAATEKLRSRQLEEVRESSRLNFSCSIYLFVLCHVQVPFPAFWQNAVCFPFGIGGRARCPTPRPACRLALLPASQPSRAIASYLSLILIHITRFFYSCLFFTHWQCD